MVQLEDRAIHTDSDIAKKKKKTSIVKAKLVFSFIKETQSYKHIVTKLLEGL